MQTIKTAIVVVLLLFVLYGGYVAMNGTDSQLKPALRDLISFDQTMPDVSGSSPITASTSGNKSNSFDMFNSSPSKGFASNANVPSFANPSNSEPAVPPISAHHLAGFHRHQLLAFFAFFGIRYLIGRFFAINGQPAGFDQHLAFCFKAVADRLGNARRYLVFSAGVKHRHEAAHHQSVELVFGLAQAAGRLQSGNDGKVVAHFAVVKYALGLLDVAVVESHQRMRLQVLVAAVREHLKGFLHHWTHWSHAPNQYKQKTTGMGSR